MKNGKRKNKKIEKKVLRDGKSNKEKKKPTMNPLHIVERLEELRQNIFDVYKSIPEEKMVEMEVEDPSKNSLRKEFYEEFEESIKPYMKEIRKNIFILLCMGYYTNTVEGEEVYDKYIFTMEEIDEMYSEEEFHSQPLMRTFGPTSNPISDSFPHPRTISLNPDISLSLWTMSKKPTLTLSEEELIKNRKKNLIYSRVYLDTFVALYLKLWEIGMDVKDGDIQIIEPPENKYKFVFEISSLISRMTHIKYMIRANSLLSINIENEDE